MTRLTLDDIAWEMHDFDGVGSDLGTVGDSLFDRLIRFAVDDSLGLKSPLHIPDDGVSIGKRHLYDRAWGGNVLDQWGATDLEH